MEPEPRRRRRRRAHLDGGGGVGFAGTVEDDAIAAKRARKRFARGLEDVAAVAPPLDLPVLEQLATAPVAGIGRVVYSSNAVFLLELGAPDPHRQDEPMRAIYKPARGERPLWDFPRHSLQLRERAAYLVSAALKLEVVPPTVLRDGPHGAGSVQLFIHAREEPLPEGAAEDLENQLRRLAAFDVVVNNADRKRAHLLIDESGHLWGIDNALTFLPYPRQRTVLIELGGSDLRPEDAESLRRFAGDAVERERLGDALRLILDPSEVDGFEARIDALAAEPWYPRLDAWEGRPFEWW